jgi:hypothetical protein
MLVAAAARGRKSFTDTAALELNVRMRVEFLAHRLLSASYQGESVTLATPLYVAHTA